MYKLPFLAHLIKDLSFKFCNLSIGLDESSPFEYNQQNVLLLKPVKKQAISKNMS
jgi:hypothetical protein